MGDLMNYAKSRPMLPLRGCDLGHAVSAVKVELAPGRRRILAHAFGFAPCCG